MLIEVAVNGLPGRAAMAVAEEILKEENMNLVEYSLTGEEITEDYVYVNGFKISLIRPSELWKFDSFLYDKASEKNPIIMVDFTTASAVNKNVQFYIEHGFSFIIGTTGGDEKQVKEDVLNSSVNAVVAPNMAPQIAVFQEMIKFAASNFPGIFEGFSLTMTESHPFHKKGKSGTMMALIPYFRDLGMEADEVKINPVRFPDEQIKLGISEKFIGAHAWHTYSLAGPGIELEFVHNVCGRKIYAQGTIKAINFVCQKSISGVGGKVFSMIDVLKNE